MNKTFIIVVMALCSMAFATHAEAQAIEHQGDRIIINVEEMDLKGDESLFDILMTMPECMSINGRDCNNNDLYGRWAIRIDNEDICVDDRSFLKNTKARDLKQIKICMNPGVMKGCGGTKKIIDCYFRTPENGTHGTLNIEGGSYGNASSFNTVNHQHDNFNVKGWLIGNLGYGKDYESGISSHSSREDAKVQGTWDITEKDNLLFNLNQSVSRSRVTSQPAANSNDYAVNLLYTRTFSDAGAYGLFELGGFYDDIKEADGGHSKEFSPYNIIEFSFPLISHDLWITPGIEMGYSGIRDVKGSVTNRQHYQDFYLQADWQVKKFHLMVGDRYRIVNYYNNNDAWEHTWSNHYYTFSAWVDIDKHNTLQGTFAHRFFAPDNETFNITDSNDKIIGYEYKDIYKPDFYVSEMRYTFQKKNLILTTLLQNVHQDFERGERTASGNDNCLSLGVTANWKICDWLRTTMGANYNWERYHNKQTDYIKHNNFVNLRLMPEIRLNDWRILATMFYNSGRSTDEAFPYYTKSNFYAALRVSKDFGPKWNVYLDAHDLADQRLGNREALIGMTYKW